MGAQYNQPDWQSIAEKFDVWLPQLAPVGDALIKALEVEPGQRVLDVACGTGEPALTLAKRMGGSVDIVGIDAAPGMIDVANTKAGTRGLQGVTFEAMPAEALAFPDESFDRVLCRFGVMLFEQPLQGVMEMHRVLRPGGRFALAVWSRPEAMPTLHWTYEVFKDRVPEAHHPPLTRATSLGMPGLLEDLLGTAGFTDFVVEPRKFDYEFESFDAYWDTVEASDILKQQYDALPNDQRAEVRDEVGRFAMEFIQEDGLRIPHEYLLACGVK